MTNTLKTPSLLLSIASSVTRKLVTIAGTALATTDIVTQTQVDSFIHASTPVVTGIVLVGLSQLWSIIDKLSVTKKITTLAEKVSNRI